jgi:putative transcriptional regulator
MKAVRKTKRSSLGKRNLFNELQEGMMALSDAREGKRTLRTHTVEFKPAEFCRVGDTFSMGNQNI